MFFFPEIIQQRWITTETMLLLLLLLQLKGQKIASMETQEDLQIRMLSFNRLFLCWIQFSSTHGQLWDKSLKSYTIWKKIKQTNNHKVKNSFNRTSVVKLLSFIRTMGLEIRCFQQVGDLTLYCPLLDWHTWKVKWDVCVLGKQQETRLCK